MSAETTLNGFSGLPAELRIKIYEQILRDVNDKPTLRALYPYRGLILSCIQVKEDFEYEWAKLVNHLVAKALDGCELSVSPVASLQDAAHVTCIASQHHSPPSVTCTGRAFTALATIFSKVTLRLDATWPGYGNTMRDFFHSLQYKFLDRVRYEARRLNPRSDVRIDHLLPGLVTTQRTVTNNRSQAPSRFNFPGLYTEVQRRIYQELGKHCGTLEQLEECGAGSLLNTNSDVEYCFREEVWGLYRG